MSRHRFDAVSFVFGVLFVAAAGAGFLGPRRLALVDLAWVGPALLILLGLVAILTASRTSGDDAGVAAAGPGMVDDDAGGAGGVPVDAGGVEAPATGGGAAAPDEDEPRS